MDGRPNCRRADNSRKFLSMTAPDTFSSRDIRRILAADAWFGSLPEVLQCKIIEYGTVRSFSKRALISTQESSPKAMCAVLEGRVRVTRMLADGEESLYHIGNPGFWFGPLAVITNEKTTVSVIGDTDGRLLVLSRAQFERIVGEDPMAYRYFALLIAQRYAGVLRYTSDTKLMAPEARVRARLAELLLLQRSLVPQSGPVTVKISQVDLAAMVGVSRQTLNELLKLMERRGLIEVAFRSIRVMDPERLRDEPGN
ncbi:Crp/Fnr family transcriptional regulator [Cupriavidus basilensis]|uniref:Crp/Fnr family transcriptional regulator n=1 Tax=Cupriavidus basilensis TaxID=68895 RepID=UPI0023E7EFF7|nr:Crp/Fnr family transcriptional regulator [Cupriavidus basilensis]MDF3888010.1 Crp/Fnr family transcriptional regulator [Cupriavidus basilensis]